MEAIVERGRLEGVGKSCGGDGVGEWDGGDGGMGWWGWRDGMVRMGG